MKNKIKAVYYCEFCKKYGLSKYHMEKHEKGCVNNPENFVPCFSGCINLTRKDAFIYGNYYDGSEWERKIENLFYCDAKRIFLYTRKNQIKQNFYDLDEVNELMPKVCDKFDMGF